MISINNITIRFGDFELLRDVSFVINPRERAGLTGRNGSGKTTLFRVICGEQPVSSGSVAIPKDTTIGYLPQTMKTDDSRTIIEETNTAFKEVNELKKEIEELTNKLDESDESQEEINMDLADKLAEAGEKLEILGGNKAEGKAELVLKGLGFEQNDFTRLTSELSGGWRMRIELAKLLLQNPDVLMLDEPTNHLDIESIQWLEYFLSEYNGAVIIVSHDRAFLDNLTKRTLEISMGDLYDYNVPYTRFTEIRQERREQQLATRRNEDKKINQTERFIERFRYKNTKSVQVQSRIKQLEKMERTQVEEEDTANIHFRFPKAPHGGKVALEITELSKSYGKTHVLDKIDMTIERGEKIAFVGRNGEGKTTLSRIVTGELEYDGGMKLGHQLSIGYYAQDEATRLDEKRTVFQTLDDMAVGDIRKQVRSILGSFLFRGEDVDKRVKVLSGGERSRLALACLLLKPVNLLVLDEPTNHLDIRSKEVLKKALLQYDGTLILVSHDRDFLDGLANKIYEFRNRKVKQHQGDIYEFLRKKNIANFNELNLKKEKVKQNQQDKTGNKQEYEKRKEHERDVRKVARKVEQAEKRIASLENEMATLSEKFGGEEEAVHEDFERYEKLKTQLDEEMKKWERFNAELEKM